MAIHRFWFDGGNICRAVTVPNDPDVFMTADIIDFVDIDRNPEGAVGMSRGQVLGLQSGGFVQPSAPARPGFTSWTSINHPEGTS